MSLRSLLTNECLADVQLSQDYYFKEGFYTGDTVVDLESGAVAHLDGDRIIWIDAHCFDFLLPRLSSAYCQQDALDQMIEWMGGPTPAEWQRLRLNVEASRALIDHYINNGIDEDDATDILDEWQEFGIEDQIPEWLRAGVSSPRLAHALGALKFSPIDLERRPYLAKEAKGLLQQCDQLARRLQLQGEQLIANAARIRAFVGSLYDEIDSVHDHERNS